MRKLEIKDYSGIATKALAAKIDIKALSDDGEFEGYGSTFGNVDRGMDRVLPGAFRATLKERPLNSIKLLRDHDTRKLAGQWLELAEDDRGLKVRGRLFMKEGRDGTDLGRETYTLLKAGALDALSIGYRTVKAKWDEDTSVRDLIELDLWEVSVVTFPMNELASVDAVKRDGFTPREIERLLREGGVPNAFAKLIAIHGYDGAKARLGTRREGGSELATVLREAAQKMKNLKGI